VTPRAALATYGKLALMALFWGGTFIGGRVAAGEMAPIAAAFWRYAIAIVALVIAAYAFERGLPRLSGRQWLGVTLLGATGVLMFNFCFMYGLARVPASRASLIMAFNPAVTLLASAVFLHERLTRAKVLGIAVALLGVTVVLGHGNPARIVSGSVGIGEVVLFGCPIAWTANTLVARRMLAQVSAIGQTAWGAITGTAMLGIALALQGGLAWPAVSARAWSALLFLGLLGTAFALVLFYNGVRRIGAARASVFINLVPVFAVLLGVLLLHEALETSMLVGGALVIGGILLMNRPAASLLAGARTHAA
jgi:drug/metabolite transporter (DMT)-like permease